MEIYLDNSATTKPYKEVIDKMVYALDTDYANPSSLHRKGVEVEKNIKNIRQSIARTLGAKDKEIYFTSGGTESNNTIIRGIVALNKKRKNHIISTTIEHPSVLNTLKDLESELEHQRDAGQNDTIIFLFIRKQIIMCLTPIRSERNMQLQQLKDLVTQ